MVNLIGQRSIKEKISRWPSLPNFMIFEGEKGSGRKTLIRYISELFEANSIVVDNKVDNIREIIEDASSLFNERIYILDGNDMSIGAKNSLLKITEEPERRCHIALLVSSTEKSLPTLVSRANVITMLPYTEEDKIAYLDAKLALDDGRIYSDYARLASNLGEIDKLLEFGIPYVYDRAWGVYNSIWDVTPSNALNITNWMKTKKNDDEDKMEPLMFMKALYNLGGWITLRDANEMTWDEAFLHNRFLLETSKCIQSLQNKSASTEITLNRWLRKVKTLG